MPDMTSDLKESLSVSIGCYGPTLMHLSGKQGKNTGIAIKFIVMDLTVGKKTG